MKGLTRCQKGGKWGFFTLIRRGEGGKQSPYPFSLPAERDQGLNDVCDKKKGKVTLSAQRKGGRKKIQLPFQRSLR